MRTAHVPSVQGVTVTIIVAACLLALAGCASHLTYGPNGQLVASNYSISETLDSSGKVTSRTYTPFVPDRWYSDAMDKIGPMISQFSPIIGKFIELYKAGKLIPPEFPPYSPAPSPPTPAPPAPTPTPYPAPVPTPNPLPPQEVTSVFTTAGNLITLDLNTLPGSMRKAGFQGSDNALYYVMAHVYAYGPVKHFVPHPDLNPLNTDEIRGAMFKWFDNAVLSVVSMMKANPALALIAITNDGKDRCGFRLGPAILARVGDAGLGSRAQLGKILPPEEY